MKAIIAVNNLGIIGRDGKLPWHSKDDLAHFKKMTENQTLICGYNTFQTLPEVVKKRTKVICDDRNMIWIGDVWCIGGKKTYEKYANQFTELHISYIDNDEEGDCTFPDLKLNKDCKIFTYKFS